MFGCRKEKTHYIKWVKAGISGGGFREENLMRVTQQYMLEKNYIILN